MLKIYIKKLGCFNQIFKIRLCRISCDIVRHNAQRMCCDWLSATTDRVTASFVLDHFDQQWWEFCCGLTPKSELVVDAQPINAFLRVSSHSFQMFLRQNWAHTDSDKTMNAALPSTAGDKIAFIWPKLWT